MLKIAICDDEKAMRDTLVERTRTVLAKLDTEAKTDSFGSGAALLAAYEAEKRPFDLVLLDIRMGEPDGMETAKRIRRIDSEVMIIFITSSAEHVFQGYEVKAFRYIMKPELDYSFDRVLKEALHQLLHTEEAVFAFQFGTESVRLPVAEILYCESRKRILIIFTQTQEYKTYEKMDNAETALSKNDFVRCHQSFLVNVKHIREWNGHEITLNSGTVIPVSKRYQKAISEAILWTLR